MSKIRRLSSFRKAVKTHGDSLDRVSVRRTKVAAKDSRTHPIAMEWVNLRELKPDPTNARKHSRQQIRKLARDIQKNSFINPILITQDGNIVAGHARLEAAQLAGLPEVPVIRLTLTKAGKDPQHLGQQIIRPVAFRRPDVGFGAAGIGQFRYRH